MRGARAYLDCNATAPLRPEARAATVAALDLVGNPSSIHTEGRAARAVVERARAQVAEAVGCRPEEVVFTSGASEAASVLARFRPEREVLVDATAHDCLVVHADGPIGGDSGDRPGRVFAMGLANGETGAIDEMPEKVEGRWRSRGAGADLLLLDLAQAVGRIPFAFGWSGADLAILSAHKIGGPKGVGALIVREGIEIPPLQSGGGQETKRRAGTENVAAIAGFGAAAEAAISDLAAGAWERVAALRDMLEERLESGAPDTIFVRKGNPRLPNTASFAVPGWKGETQVMQMDLAGFAVSAGSACSSGKVRSGRVLQAMGFDAVTATSAIRVSLGPMTTEEEIVRFADAWLAHHERFRARAA